MVSYRAILKQAWTIAWKNKILWFFGFFASLISFGAEMTVISRAVNQDTGLKIINDLGMIIKTGIFSRNTFKNIIEIFRQSPGEASLLFLFLIFILAATLFFIWLATSSQISIIDAIKKINKNTKEKINLKKQLQKANKKFWPVLSMNLISYILINGLTILTGFLLIYIITKEKILFSFIYGLVFIVLIPIILIISFIIKYSIAYIVIDGKKFFIAFEKGWELFKRNWLISIEIAITLFFINLLAITIISSLAFFSLVLVIGIAMASIMLISPSVFLFWILIIIAVLIALIIIIIGSSIVNAFQISTWTNLFIKLKEAKIKNQSKLERIFYEDKELNK